MEKCVGHNTSAIMEEH
jgi:hypothetical protein